MGDTVSSALTVVDEPTVNQDVRDYVADAQALAEAVREAAAAFKRVERLARKVHYAGNTKDSRAWQVFGASAIGGGIHQGARDMLGWFAEMGDADNNGSCFEFAVVLSDLEEFEATLGLAVDRNTQPT